MPISLQIPVYWSVFVEHLVVGCGVFLKEDGLSEFEEGEEDEYAEEDDKKGPVNVSYGVSVLCALVWVVGDDDDGEDHDGEQAYEGADSDECVYDDSFHGIM